MVFVLILIKLKYINIVNGSVCLNILVIDDFEYL